MGVLDKFLNAMKAASSIPARIKFAAATAAFAIFRMRLAVSLTINEGIGAVTQAPNPTQPVTDELAAVNWTTAWATSKPAMRTSAPESAN